MTAPFKHGDVFAGGAERQMAKAWHDPARGGWFYMLNMNEPRGPFVSRRDAIEMLLAEAEPWETTPRWYRLDCER